MKYPRTILLNFRVSAPEYDLLLKHLATTEFGDMSRLVRETVLRAAGQQSLEERVTALEQKLEAMQ